MKLHNNHWSLHRFVAVSSCLSLILCLAPLQASAQDDAGQESAETKPAQVEQVKDKSPLAKFNEIAGYWLFYDLAFGRLAVPEVDRKGNPVLDADGRQGTVPVKLKLLVVFLLLGSIFFTLWYRWINVRGFKHSLDVIRGRFDRPEDIGEISHFRALTSALSATVGLGNIAGVALAVMGGGPGAIFWMLVAAVFGMTAKFSSCTLSQMYRKRNADNSISGGPMYYLDLGLKQMGPVWGILGKILAIEFAIMVMGGAIGGGNMFQVNQSVEAITDTFGWEWQYADWALGIIVAVLVGLVIIGGITRIGAATSKIVPIMCGLYVVASLFIILVNFTKIPAAFELIFSMAFTKNAFFGGTLGVLIWGITRAAFSNEAGLGSAAIAHAAAKTEEPVREGIVAMIGPFIDTIIVCLMTALVVVITGAWELDQFTKTGGEFKVGVKMTTWAFNSAIPGFKYILTGCIVLFAYSTMISWCYYGERGWIYLLDHSGEGNGLKSVIVFRIVFVVFIVVGAVNPIDDVLGFSDLMILSMALPNIVGSVILAPVVLKRVKDYWSRYTSGEMKPIR